VSTRFGPGSTFGGSNGKRFIVEAVAGRGGQAEVFRCMDTRLHRKLALKVCTAPDGTNRKLYLDRFEHELRLTSRVQHPHVLPVYDCGELDDGQPWVMLEWMQHGSLADLVKRERDTGYYIPLSYAHYYATAMAAALRAAHSAEIVHRDVKPDNVLVGQDGVAKLTDFGIAKDLTAEAPQLTAIGQTMGTLGFMANEQLKGLPGPQSDIFSWGISVYALLMGRMPKQQVINSIPMGIMAEDSLADAPPAFLPVLLRATALDLQDRYPSFTEVLADLSRLDLTSPDTRPLFTPDSLPALPSGAFVSGSTTTGGTRVPVILLDGTVPSQDPVTFDATLNTVAGDDGAFADTADLAVAGADPTAETQMAPGVDPDTAPTRAQSVVGLTNAPPPAAQVRPAKRKRKRKAQPVGPTRITQGTSKDSPRPATRLVLIAIIVVLGLAVGAMVWLRGGVPEPDPVAERAASTAYAAAILQGDAAAAASAAEALPASSTDRAAGKLVQAWDALLQGQPNEARSLSAPLLSEPAPMGAEAALITAASHRLAGAEGYEAALPHYRAAASCTKCGPVAAHAERGVQQSCFVLGGSVAGCADALGSLGERDRLFAAASVLRADGHSAAAGLQLSLGLATAAGAPSCLESAVLREFSAPVGVPADDFASAKNAAARSAADCGAGLR
jgi:tRNA A-37 threonylcarbamoyl transferase component Bud32